MSNGIYYIYKIINLINQMIYIGYTSTTPQNRFKDHLYLAMKTKSSYTYLYNVIRKYGFKYISALSCFTNTDKPIHTRNKDFPYNNYYIKYIDNLDKV